MESEHPFGDEQVAMLSVEQRRRMLSLLYLACFVEGADMQLLPSSFLAMERDVGLTPVGLATMMLCQALLMSIAAPAWGILIDQGAPAKAFLVGGTFAWGLLTLLLAAASSFWFMVGLRMLNGVALATLSPVCQVVLAKLSLPAERGRYFSGVGVAMGLGNVICAVVTTSMSNHAVLGMQGWRVAFSIVAALSFLLCFLLLLGFPNSERKWRHAGLYDEFVAFLGYFRIGSFNVIVVQGCFGSIPWSALSFLTMFFQYIGIVDSAAGMLTSVMILSQAVGNLIGGAVSDSLTAQSRYHGRPLTAQISVICGVPLVGAVLVLVPRSPNSVGLYMGLLVAFGLVGSWCGNGVNRPLLTEVVAASNHARVISWLAALEGSAAACFGAPLVGYLSQHAFGYQPQHRPVSEVPMDVRLANTEALARSMLWMTVLPWLLCFLAYSSLHITYRHDVEALGRAVETLEGAQRPLLKACTSRSSSSKVT